MSEKPLDLSSAPHELAALVAVQPGAVVSRALVNKPAGTVTLFAFDAGEGLSEHTAPYDALVPVMAWLMSRTRFGSNVRAVGENPEAADTAGVNVCRTRYIALIIGGGLMGLAGAFLSLAQLGTFTFGLVAGRGWIAITLVIFGNWQPFKVMMGALLFGAVQALQLRLQAEGVTLVPYEVLLALPYLITIAALAFAGCAAEAVSARVTASTRLDRDIASMIVASSPISSWRTFKSKKMNIAVDSRMVREQADRSDHACGVRINGQARCTSRIDVAHTISAFTACSARNAGMPNSYGTNTSTYCKVISPMISPAGASIRHGSRPTTPAGTMTNGIHWNTLTKPRCQSQ